MVATYCTKRITMKIKSPQAVKLFVVGYLLVLGFLIGGGIAKSVKQNVDFTGKPGTILISPLLVK